MEDLERYHLISSCFVAYSFSYLFSYSLAAAIRHHSYPVILPSSSLPPFLSDLSFSSWMPFLKRMTESCHFSYQGASQHQAVRPAAAAAAHLAVDSAVDASEKRHAVICAQHLLEEVLAALADAAEIRLIQMKSIRTRHTGKAVASCLVVVLAAKARVDQVVSVVVRPAVAVVLPGVEEVLPAASRRERETCLEDVRNLRWC